MTYLHTGKVAAIRPEWMAAIPEFLIDELAPSDEPEVLSFLNNNIARTFGLVGVIRANGLVSPNNRGTFYACRDREGRIEGVALIGYCTIFETRRSASEETTIKTFARLADNCPDIRIVLGEEKPVESFWQHCSGNQRAFESHRYFLMAKQRSKESGFEPVHALRRATQDDLNLVAAAHAQSILEEVGGDRLEPDEESFLHRCAERIQRGQTWIWTEGKRLIAKAEVVTDTPEVNYLEAIWITDNERRKGYGSRFVSQLSNTLLEETESVCLLVREENLRARGLYNKVGYKATGSYRAIFV